MKKKRQLRVLATNGKNKETYKCHKQIMFGNFNRILIEIMPAFLWEYKLFFSKVNTLTHFQIKNIKKIIHFDLLFITLPATLNFMLICWFLFIFSWVIVTPRH